MERKPLHFFKRSVNFGSLEISNRHGHLEEVIVESKWGDPKTWKLTTKFVSQRIFDYIMKGDSYFVLDPAYFLFVHTERRHIHFMGAKKSGP